MAESGADPVDRQRSLWYLDTSAVSIRVVLQCAASIVVLAAFGGVPESHAVVERLAFNVLGAGLAVAALRLWPTPGVVPDPEPELESGT